MADTLPALRLIDTHTSAGCPGAVLAELRAMTALGCAGEPPQPADSSTIATGTLRNILRTPMIAPCLVRIRLLRARFNGRGLDLYHVGVGNSKGWTSPNPCSIPQQVPVSGDDGW